MRCYCRHRALVDDCELNGKAAACVNSCGGCDRLNLQIRVRLQVDLQRAGAARRAMAGGTLLKYCARGVGGCHELIKALDVVQQTERLGARIRRAGGQQVAVVETAKWNYARAADLL